MQQYTDEQLIEWIENDRNRDQLVKRADSIRREFYGDEVYIRGLIEFTNYCKNNCYYCGIRAGNNSLERYRLSRTDILSCCKEGYELGFRTFVLQGGEDFHYKDIDICHIVSDIKNQHPDCAVTLSIGEKSRESYREFFAAGADRYLLREETASETHYRKLHPEIMSCENRKRCLWNLKEIGFQVGAGFMVGSPFQETKHLLSDLRFLEELQPDMIGIGPFLRHKDTPFCNQLNGSFEMTLRLISILRILFPYALIPATTALGTIDPLGREKGLQAGANVIMPNLSPENVKKKYELYDHKLCTGGESAKRIESLTRRVKNAGYRIVSARGDVKK